MNVRPLILTPEVRAEAEAICKFALSSRLDIVTLRGFFTAKPGVIGNTLENEEPRKNVPSVGDDKRRRMTIPVGHRVVFSIEEQPDPKLRWSRHISVSVFDPRTGRPTRGTLPSEHSFTEICKLFGMSGELSKGPLFTEGQVAINYIEPMDPQPFPPTTVVKISAGETPAGPTGETPVLRPPTGKEVTRPETNQTS